MRRDGHACDLRFVVAGAAVVRRDQVHRVALFAQVVAEGFDRRRDAVDPGEIDVGDEQNFHVGKAVESTTS
jgi:hypothetical protein